MQQIVTLIPAYQPKLLLLDVVRQLLEDGASPVVVVDDGSQDACRWIFDQLLTFSDVHVIRHAVNLGKGAALKTGINYTLTAFPNVLGVVTADADGQHHHDDVRRVTERLAACPQELVLGVRQFDRKVPFRNRFGNNLTRQMVRLIMGQNISDTQTGLRGIPRSLMEQLLRVRSNGYEFELDMLTTAKHRNVAVAEEPIRTIYDHPDQASHFNPLVDSMKIYAVLLRFGLVSLLSAGLDNLVFFLVYSSTSSILAAQVVGRTLSMLFNYSASKRAVFLSRERNVIIFPKYCVLVFINALVSYCLISFISSHTPVPVMWCKIMVESVLFLANFAIQRDFIFVKGRAAEAEIAPATPLSPETEQDGVLPDTDQQSLRQRA